MVSWCRDCRHRAMRLPALLLVEKDMAFSLHCVFSNVSRKRDLSFCLRERSFKLRE